MNLQQAIEQIVNNWELLKDKSNDGDFAPKMVAVWCAKSDIAGEYEVDEEWIGITPQGRIAWAYASGCSCWDGDFDEKRFTSMKEVTLKQDSNTPEEWEKAIIKFAETGVRQEL